QERRRARPRACTPARLSWRRGLVLAPQRLARLLVAHLELERVEGRVGVEGEAEAAEAEAPPRQQAREAPPEVARQQGVDADGDGAVAVLLGDLGAVAPQPPLEPADDVLGGRRGVEALGAEVPLGLGDLGG